MTEKLDDLIDEMFALRECSKQLEADKKKIDAEYRQIQETLIERYGEVGTNYARGTLASATLTESIVPQIADWGEVSEWVMENDAIYLLHRRISTGPWRELRDAGTVVPGIEPYNKIAISLRRLGD